MEVLGKGRFGIWTQVCLSSEPNPSPPHYIPYISQKDCRKESIRSGQSLLRTCSWVPTTVKWDPSSSCWPVGFSKPGLASCLSVLSPPLSSLHTGLWHYWLRTFAPAILLPWKCPWCCWDPAFHRGGFRKYLLWHNCFELPHKDNCILITLPRIVWGEEVVPRDCGFRDPFSQHLHPPGWWAVNGKNQTERPAGDLLLRQPFKWASP